jgi:hypothetical protein
VHAQRHAHAKAAFAGVIAGALEGRVGQMMGVPPLALGEALGGDDVAAFIAQGKRG